MKKMMSFFVVIGISLAAVASLQADVCKVRCRTEEGLVCLERGPCEPINEFLLKAAKECREDPSVRYMPITKLMFVDILSRIIRLDKELPGNIDELKDEERYVLETKLLAGKGIDIFIGTGPLSPLTREELATVLKNVAIEKDLGFSTGLPNQIFDVGNETFVIYDVKLYVDEGNGFELWERKENIEKSLADDRHYSIKLDSCGATMAVFGDNKNGKTPIVGSRLRISYKFYGREDEVVTECEIAMLLSNPDLARSLKDIYNPSRPLTKANFADLLIRSIHLEKELPRDSYNLTARELYLLQTQILSKKGINIFIGSEPEDLLTREELARVLYDSPVETIVGISDGTDSQHFELNNAGFVIYDLHTYVNEGVGYEEWNKKDSFIESSSVSTDYLVKLDSGNYASIYFGDNKKGKIPVANSPVRVSYRLYAPLTMLNEDDIICVLGKLVPVPEAYEPPFSPPDFPPPADGFDDPATHI